MISQLLSARFVYKIRPFFYLLNLKIKIVSRFCCGHKTEAVCKATSRDDIGWEFCFTKLMEQILKIVSTLKSIE